jgi:hypothetical protein
MGKKDDFRDFINPEWPTGPQLMVLTGETYTDPDAWIRSLRPGSIARVLKPSYLGPRKGRTKTRRAVLTDRMDKIDRKGIRLVSVDPVLSGNKFLLRAYEEIADARGGVTKGKRGRRAKAMDLDASDWAAIRAHCPPRKGKSWDAAKDAVNMDIAPKKLSRTWLFDNWNTGPKLGRK